MTRRLWTVALLMCFVTLSGTSMFAGGRLEQIDITGRIASPIPGQLVARLVGIQWDVRAIPVKYVVNASQDPVPNPLGPAFLSVADATAAFQRAFDSWNNIPTSYMESHIVGTTAKTTLAGFDMINEVSFRTASTFTAIAVSPSVTLIEDTTLVDGDDLDGDGDSDVSSTITQVTDVDHDGDLEFPAGFYKAGTILDNDVQFNTKASNGLRFTVTDAAVDTVIRSVDLEAVAVHEFGHSLGLSHVPNNQKNREDGTGATMFPFIDTGDPAAELATRSLDSDDIAWASYVYPEGSAAAGVAALQGNDVSFASAYGLISGSVHHGVLNQPVAGASVSAIERHGETLVATGFSGTTQVSFNPADGGLFVVDPAFDILDGRFTIPVPKGDYAVSAEPIDGNPVPASSISLTAQIGSIFGQLNFNAEFYNRNEEAASEVRPGQEKNVPVNPGKTRSGIDIVTNATVNLNNFGSRDFVGFAASPGLIYAVRFPKSQIANFLPGQDILIQSGLFDTTVFDASVAPVFARAALVSGSVDAAGNVASLDLSRPLDEAEGFLGADDNFAPFFFKNAHELGKRVRRDLERGNIQDLFVVLQIPTSAPFAGVSGLPPLIGLDGGRTPADAPVFGFSYTSDDGGMTWIKSTTFNFRFSLVLAAPPAPGS